MKFFASYLQKCKNYYKFIHHLFLILISEYLVVNMTQNHKQLFGHCVNVLNTYNGDTMSVEEHVNKYLKENGVIIYNIFILASGYKITEFKKLLYPSEMTTR